MCRYRSVDYLDRCWSSSSTRTQRHAPPVCTHADMHYSLSGTLMYVHRGRRSEAMKQCAMSAAPRVIPPKKVRHSTFRFEVTLRWGRSSPSLAAWGDPQLNCRNPMMHVQVPDALSGRKGQLGLSASAVSDALDKIETKGCLYSYRALPSECHSQYLPFSPSRSSRKTRELDCESSLWRPGLR